MILYWLVRLCSSILQRLPLSLAYAVGDRAANLTFLFWCRGRINMIDNMAHVLGPTASRRTVRNTAARALKNYLRYLVDFLRTPQSTAEEIVRRVSFSQWSPLDEAAASGKGTIFAGLHMGNWDVGGALLAQRGYKTNAVVETFTNSRLDAFVQRMRTHLGVKTIPRDLAGRRALRALRHNEGIALMMDLPAKQDEGVEITFFDHSAWVPAGAATLALWTGARIVPTGMVRLPDNRFLGIVDGCIVFEPTGNHAEDVRALTQQIMDTLERWITQYPDQWFMFRRMWPEAAERSNT